MTAWGSPTMYVASAAGSPLFQHLDAEHCPALLLSYYYLWGARGGTTRGYVPEGGWFEDRAHTTYRCWCMDSGAFSAWALGVTISFEEYLRCCQEQLAVDPTLTEVFALDDIKSWRNTTRNTERMWAAGVPAIPVYHIGEPEDVLVGYARDYPKIAIGGMARVRGRVKQAFVEQCFSRVWPCAVHGLAATSEDVVMAVPWHSVDASSCETGPRKYGRWKAYGGVGGQGGALSVRRYYDLRPEVRWYLDLEAKMRWKWRREMREVGDRLRAAGWRGYV